MNFEEEINKLITEYFSKHNEVLMNGKDAMLRDNYAKLDAIDLVCDIANVYNSAVYQSTFEALKTPIEKIDTGSAHKNTTHKNIDRFADAVFWNLYHIRG
jgi:hypothetical protein